MTKITTILSDSNTISNPILANFQIGSVKPNASFNFKLHEDNKKNAILSVAADNNIYSGKITKNNVYNNYIVIRNKKTNKARVVQINNIFLEPVFPKKEELSETIKDNTDKSLISIRELQKKFGSKKAKRQTEQYERMKMDVSNVEEQLIEAVENVEVTENMTVPEIKENNAYKPPVNRDASTVQQIYNLEDIIPKNLLKTLNTDFQKYIQENENKIKFSQFVESEMRKLNSSESSSSNKKHSLLLYLDLLMKMLITNSKQISHKKYQPCPFSYKISTFMLDNFTQMGSHGRCRPATIRDKTLCYVLVLAIIISDYQLNLEDIAQDLKINVNRLQEFCRVLYFSQLNPKDKNIMVLKLPLPNVSLTSSSKKRSKRK